MFAPSMSQLARQDWFSIVIVVGLEHVPKLSIAIS
jgi:hypothetical protein